MKEPNLDTFPTRADSLRGSFLAHRGSRARQLAALRTKAKDILFPPQISLLAHEGERTSPCVHRAPARRRCWSSRIGIASLSRIRTARHVERTNSLAGIADRPFDSSQVGRTKASNILFADQ